MARAGAGPQACCRQTGRRRLWTQGPLLPSLAQGLSDSLTHSANTRQKAACACPRHRSVREDGGGEAVSDLPEHPRMWNSVPGCGTLSPDVELRPRMWNSIPGCGNLQLNCTRLGSLGGPVVKTSPSDAGRVGLIPPGGAGAAHALWPKKPRCRTEPIL